MGRPRIVLDAHVIRTMAQYYCTVEEIAVAMQVSKDTLERNYMDDIEAGRAEGRASLRRQQFNIAMDPDHKGCTTMCIWLGKQTLGQRDFKLESISDELLAAEIERRMKENAKVKSGK